MTTFLLACAVLAVAALTRHITLIAMAYLALRHSPPEQRSAILRDLGSVLIAVHPPGRHGLSHNPEDMSPDDVSKINDRECERRAKIEGEE